MSYEIFRRTWWKDDACTVPGPGRKHHVCYVESEAEARETCRRLNREKYGKKERGPRGMAHEFERVRD